MRRLPAHLVNGITVALGIGMVQFAVIALVGGHAGLLATSGAVCASLADRPNTVSRTWRRVLAAALLGSAAALTVSLLRPCPIGLGVGIAVIAFVAMMVLAWGPRAGPASFAAVLSIVFTMAAPPGAQTAWALFGWHVAGAVFYLLWAIASGALLQARYRSLALAAAVEATARLLRSRAALLEARDEVADELNTLGQWVTDETALAERLQAARDLLFAAPDTPRARRHTAILLHTIELRDILLASRLDVDLLGLDEAGRRVRAGLASHLRQIARQLDATEAALRRGAHKGSVEASAPLVALAALPVDDRRIPLLQAIVRRTQHLNTNLAAIRGLLRGVEEPLPLTRGQLRRFVAPDGWPPSAVGAQLAMDSPVFRHALRSALALGSAYFIALALPWASHPHWLVLSVAVVLRVNLGQTLSRRNARVLGTLFGCLLVLLLALAPPSRLQPLAFFLGAGVAHAYVTVHYVVTAGAGTVMALLQAHFVDPTAGFPIAERLADTVLGALLAWAFSYVLPSWERRSLPRTVARALASLREYAQRALTDEGPAAVAQRLARRKAYDALEAVAAAVQRSASEPARVRAPMRELWMLVDHGQRLMAHLSVIRLALARGGPELDLPQARAALRAAHSTMQDCLSPGAGMHGDETIGTPDPGQLPAVPPANDALPWLLRRLQMSVDDSRRVRVSARLALDALRGPVPSR